MRRPLVVVLLLIVLSGCSAPAATVESPSASNAEGDPTTSVPSESPTPEVAAVDPSEYRTELGGGSSHAEVDGVDFDSADGNLHCGIFDPNGEFAPEVGCIAGSTEFAWPEIDAFGAMTPANAVVMYGDEPAGVTIVTDVSFAGQDPADYPNVRRLETGASITWSTITCVAGEDSITCRNSSSDHGFSLSYTGYEVD